ncbi:MAG: hypothetical protein RDU89_08740 [bacterium]|nr:hypothetical protein [bacterium]
MTSVVICRDRAFADQLSPLLPGVTVTTAPDPAVKWDVAVHWTPGFAPVNALRHLNPPAALERLASLPTARKVLRLNGLRTLPGFGQASTPSLGGGFCRVHLFDGAAISVRAPGGRYHRQNLVSMALRALYCLGLDFGAVDLRPRRLTATVLRIDPAPAVDAPLAEAYARAMLPRLAGETGDGGPVKIGADPEFIVFRRRDGRRVPASRFFRRHAGIGCDWAPGFRGFPLGELRPSPSECPLRLTETLAVQIERARRHVGGDFGLVAGSRPYPSLYIGGHVHFSGVVLTADLLRALDTYVALPVLLLEAASPASSRRRRYGFLGDCRRKRHGGFEYRTLPSWLVSPEVTAAVLCLAYLVVLEHRRLRGRLLVDPERQEAFYQADKETLRPLWPRLWADLRATPSYSRFRSPLRILPDLIERRVTWDERLELGAAWSQYKPDQVKAEPAITALAMALRLFTRRATK